MSDGPHDRRAFFREVARRALGPAADALDRMGERAPRVRPLLRPPGALPEAVFLDRCRRCGACAAACPAQAIVALDGPDERVKGTPAIVPALRPCVVCDDLACMAACPSGALERVPVDGIRIGLAVVDEGLCVRSRGEDCRLCVARCPLGERAIGIGEDGTVAVRAACVGCGVCENVCPTRPGAIVVAPLGR